MNNFEIISTIALLFNLVLFLIILPCFFNSLSFNVIATQTKLKKNGFNTSEEDLKKFLKNLNKQFGIDWNSIQIVVFTKDIKIFKRDEKFILALDNELKEIANKQFILEYLEVLGEIKLMDKNKKGAK